MTFRDLRKVSVSGDLIKMRIVTGKILLCGHSYSNLVSCFNLKLLIYLSAHDHHSTVLLMFVTFDRHGRIPHVQPQERGTSNTQLYTRACLLHTSTLASLFCLKHSCFSLLQLLQLKSSNKSRLQVIHDNKREYTRPRLCSEKRLRFKQHCSGSRTRSRTVLVTFLLSSICGKRMTSSPF